MDNVIAYYRVSTDEQNLGIPAQKEMVRDYCKRNELNVIDEFEEHESGKNNSRPKLRQALDAAVNCNCPLIVAKIDRLTRVAYFGLELCEKYRIIFCDHPKMGTLEQSIYFGMAQQEREYISRRTKEALHILKSKGIKLGAPNAKFSDEMRTESLRKRRFNSINNVTNKRAYAVVSVMDGNYSDKARFLNENGFPTARGGIWRPQQVQRLISIFEEEGRN